MTVFQRLVTGVVCMLASACFDDADRCGPSMSYDAARAECLCAPNAIAVEGGCQACADDEVVVAGACACAAGEAKNADGRCAAVTGLGDACGAAQPCTDTVYAYCAPATAGATSATCTKRCTQDADCGAAYTCAIWEPEPYCRAFAGLGDPCSAQSECTGDAKLCDTVQSHECLVGGCSLTANDCPRDTQCCDLSVYGAGNVCMPGCP